MKIRNSHGAVLLLSTALAAAGASAGESRIAQWDAGDDVAAAKQEAAMDERLRNGEVIVAPPHPLTLQRVDYPPDDELAARARQARNVRGECGC